METPPKNENNFIQSITFKLLLVVPLALFLLIPKFMINSLIEEREYRKNDVITEISQKWGNAQTITGPVLIIPYKEFYKENHEVKYMVHSAFFLPDDLKINGELQPEIRYRGIYKVPVYSSKLSISGSFATIDFSKWKVSDENIIWDNAYVVVGITDLRGVQRAIKIKWNDKDYNINPGILTSTVAYSGVHSMVDIAPDTAYSFAFDIVLNGTENINFVPVGKNTSVNMHSPWSNPSFSGAFLPDNRDISEKGFTAEWSVLDLNRNFPQKWTDSQTYSLDEAKFGVDLFLPVDHYQQSMRSVKYALMFIALTYLVFLFVEALNKKRIHFIQYILVGIALLIFYSLLLSLSEYIGFQLAYLIAAIAVVAMITLYIHGSLKNFKISGILCAILTLLYVFLYAILQLEDFALLLGSIGLFIVLGIVMYLSRKVKWFF